MPTVTASALPESSLLAEYGAGTSGATGNYVDCYQTEVPRAVNLHEFVFAFYTTPLFKMERTVLGLLAGKSSTDNEAEHLAIGNSEVFAAWSVEKRSDDQLLMCDFRGRTRSWFMVAPREADGGVGTVLRFGSAVVARRNRRTGVTEQGWVFDALLGFHKLYSKMLLRSAKSRLVRLHS